MYNFTPLTRLLAERFPASFICETGKKGCAEGLYIRCGTRGGYAFVYSPTQNSERLLLALHETESDEEPEVWSVEVPEEIVQRVHPWAFPRSRSLPEPLDQRKERKRLEKISKGLSDRTGIECRSSAPKAEFLRLLSENGLASYEGDRPSVCADRIARHFPWDASGRLALKKVVLLNQYESATAPGKDRELCLAAIGPERRGDEQVIRIELTDLIVVNQTHCWRDCRWLWTDVEIPSSELLGTESDAATPKSDQAAKSLQLLDEGKIEDALGLYGVTLSDDLQRILGGERISPPACCAHPDEAWTKLLVETLRQSAPWRFPKAVADEAERLQTWAAQKKNRRKRPPSLKLAIFPGQFHTRKASLILTGDLDGCNPRFVIEATGSNARLHDAAWKRPIAVDFHRYGVQT